LEATAIDIQEEEEGIQIGTKLNPVQQPDRRHGIGEQNARGPEVPRAATGGIVGATLARNLLRDLRSLESCWPQPASAHTF